jgi:hypothetical protein
MRWRHTSIGCALWLLGVASPGVAFFEGHAAGSRALALGGNFVSIANDASAVYWNPAGVARLSRHQALFTLDRSPDLEGVQQLFAATVLHTPIVSVAAGWSAMSLEETMREDLLSLSISRQLVRRTLGAFVSAGATLKAARIGLDAAEASAIAGARQDETRWSGDFGLLMSPIPNVTVGACVRNLGQPQFDLIEGGATTALETAVEWGLSLRLHPQAQLHWSRAHLADRSAENKLGVEFRVGNALEVRFGAARQSLSTGIAVRWRDFRVEPSFRVHDELGLMTRIAFQIDFGAPHAGGSVDDF